MLRGGQWNAAHGGLIPFGSTFFVFSDYAKPPAHCLSMEVHSLFVFTHDSIGVGEDGPTHEPIEHLMRCARCRTLRIFVLPTPMKRRPHGVCSGAQGAVLLCAHSSGRAVLDPATHDAYSSVSKGAYVLEDAANPQLCSSHRL